MRPHRLRLAQHRLTRRFTARMLFCVLLVTALQSLTLLLMWRTDASVVRALSVFPSFSPSSSPVSTRAIKVRSDLPAPHEQLDMLAPQEQLDSATVHPLRAAVPATAATGAVAATDDVAEIPGIATAAAAAANTAASTAAAAAAPSVPARIAAQSDPPNVGSVQAAGRASPAPAAGGYAQLPAPVCGERGGRGPLSTRASPLRNPVFKPKGRVRDPAVSKLVPASDSSGAYSLFFTHFRGNPRRLFDSSVEPYSVRVVRTDDWTGFSDAEDVSPAGFASPDAPVRWHSHTVIAFQAYPDKALGGPKTGLYFSTLKSKPAGTWSSPKPFLKEALSLEWNTAQRAIDPTMIVHNGTLHCFFVGSDGDPRPRKRSRRRRINMLGHAVTVDPALKEWTITTIREPLLGPSDRAPDGVENVAVFRRAPEEFVMIYSEGLAEQHLAWATSSDLLHWTQHGKLEIATQPWSRARFGAPYVWSEGGCFFMTLMGESELETHDSAIGLLTSPDGVRDWKAVGS